MLALLRSRLSLLLLLGTVGLTTMACHASSSDDGSDDGDTTDDALTSVTPDQKSAAQSESLEGLTFDHLTPTSEKLMHSSRWWMHEQDKEPRYPRPRMCAS